MPKPRIIRADTIDLQDRAQPSAKDHSGSQLPDDDPDAVGPHHAETLREVAHETADEHQRPSFDAGPDEAKARSHLYSDSDDDSSDDDHDDHDPKQGGSHARMSQQDTLAVAQNGGVQDDSDLDIDGDDLDDDDMTGGISSSPSIEDEDIDFEYVYALHTFVATVEGQANATKGDTMVLLDDSNSYWWLVRIVKDSSIGYLPAEHIETPTERLARLNKHRNIDLSATMLGDQQQEKSKPTFKTAIRRRKKTVTFAAPTYVDYSDIEYSTDEDDDQEEIFARQQQAAQQAKEQAAAAESGHGDDDDDSEIEDESARVEPLKTRAAKDTKAAEEEDSEGEHPRPSSEDMFDSKADGASRSRNGTLRNTDSFFKDDSVETKKITLTPNLLRDDGAPRESTESTKETRPRPSLDKAPDKDAAGPKDDRRKKDKDKRPSVIRNFFSRKDRKNRGGSTDDDEAGKRSMESEARDSRDDEADDGAWGAEKGGSPQRQPSKLQKLQPAPAGKAPPAQQQEPAAYVAETRNDVSNVPPVTMRIVDEDTHETIEVASAAKEELGRGDSTRSKGGEEEEPEAPAPEPASAQAQAAEGAGQPPPLVGDTSSQADSASPSPELVEEPAAAAREEGAWDDGRLRSFFEGGAGIRDMLVVVYDKTDVAPAGPDHPVVGGLFREQNAKLAEITTQLDNMLGDWLARKQRMRGSV